MLSMKRPLDDLPSLCKFLFNVQLYLYQTKIIKSIFENHKKITIRATTRAGKTFIIAVACILYATFKDKKRVGVIAPTFPKAKKVMDYIAELLNATNFFDSIVMVETEGLTKLERLRKEVSKKRITFKNGSSIEILSIDLNKQGLGAMGSAFDLIICEEVGEIDNDSYGKVYRMLVEHPDSQIVEIGNPWGLTIFYAHHHADDWEKIHVRWQDCVAAGRMTKEAVEDQRRELTELEFKVLFDADFPDELEYAIFPETAIKEMTKAETKETYVRYVAGIDVARGGRDKTVITMGGESDGVLYFIEHKVIDSRDIMRVVGEARLLFDKYPKPKEIEITVDTVGIGAGVKDRLLELGYSAKEFVAGKAAMNSARFANKKTETVFAMADAAKAGRIRNIPPGSKFVLQLRSWIYEVKSDKQLRVIDPEEKSPDEADSLLYMFASTMFRYDSSMRAGEGNIERYNPAAKLIRDGFLKDKKHERARMRV